MNAVRKTLLAAAVAGSMLVGGVAGAAGATVLSASAAASPSPSPSSSSSSSGSSGSGPAAAPGKFVPNEDPAHEATESAAREAQENAGQVPTIP